MCNIVSKQLNAIREMQALCGKLVVVAIAATLTEHIVSGNKEASSFCTDFFPDTVRIIRENSSVAEKLRLSPFSFLKYSYHNQLNAVIAQGRPIV